LADAAPTLKEAELRVILELTRRQLDTPGAVRISSRDLAAACKLARSKTITAIDSLTARCLITARQGTPTTAAAYRVNIVDTERIERIRGPLRGPLPHETRSPTGTTQVPLWDLTGPQEGPPPPENTALARAAAASDFDAATLQLIVRVFSAKARNFDKQTIEQFRRHLWGIFARFGRDTENRPFTQQNPPHPPSDDQVAIFLTTADEPRLARFLQDFFIECQSEQHPMWSYMYFVYTALARIQGVKVQTTKKARAILQEVKRSKRQRQAEQLTLDDDADAGDIRAVVAAVAGVKTLR
jgi:heme exporter protein D